MIKRYVNGRNGKRKGVLVAFRHEDGALRLGWSLCSSEDTFSEREGLKLAMVRLFDEKELGKDIPHSLVNDFYGFFVDCLEFFEFPIPEI